MSAAQSWHEDLGEKNMELLPHATGDMASAPAATPDGAWETVGVVDILGDRSSQLQMVRWSWVILAFGIATAVILWFALFRGQEPRGYLWLLAAVGISFAVLPVHELIHAAAFKLMGGLHVPVHFGATYGMLMTSAEGVILTRSRFVVVLLAPAVVVSVALLAGLCAAGYPLLAWVVCVLHLSGCTGDFGMVKEILRTHEASHVEDCSFGIRLLRRAA
ncbi:MAG: DUF3267 domain-containing protein [Atopobiaceae bacterium]